MPSPEDLPDPGIEAGSPALQADSLSTELSGKLTIKSEIRKCGIGMLLLLLLSHFSRVRLCATP